MEQRKLGDEVPNSDGTVSNSENYTNNLMGTKNAKTYVDLFCISQTKDPKRNGI